MMNQAQANRYAHSLLAYNKPSLARTVITSAAYIAVILFLGSVVGAGMGNTDSEMTKGSAYLVVFAVGFILFFFVKLISGVVKYLKNRN